jgi:signal transduction histidine kinase
LYFAVAECLTNVVKHARATAASVRLEYRNERLTVTVRDDGVGGAVIPQAGATSTDPSVGTGLAGTKRRLETFDGRMEVDSPVGGPTIVTLELPCALSSPRTLPSSETG